MAVKKQETPKQENAVQFTDEQMQMWRKEHNEG